MPSLKTVFLLVNLLLAIGFIYFPFIQQNLTYNFEFGPSNNFKYYNITINTIPKYAGLLTAVGFQHLFFILRFTYIYKEIINWYSPNTKEVTETKITCTLVTVLSILIELINIPFYISTSLLKIDVMIVVISVYLVFGLSLLYVSLWGKFENKNSTRYEALLQDEKALETNHVSKEEAEAFHNDEKLYKKEEFNKKVDEIYNNSNEKKKKLKEKKDDLPVEVRINKTESNLSKKIARVFNDEKVFADDDDDEDKKKNDDKEKDLEDVPLNDN